MALKLDYPKNNSKVIDQKSFYDNLAFVKLLLGTTND